MPRSATYLPAVAVAVAAVLALPAMAAEMKVAGRGRL
jgi:hypothetical protein